MKHLILVLLFLGVCTSHADPHLSSTNHPYYGEKFFNDLNSGISNQSLLDSLKTILRSYHIKTDGTYDQIVNSCSGSKCYKHNAVGYDAARVILMTDYYIVSLGNNQYGIKDVYCDTLKTAKDFKGGVSPSPKRLPDANVINTEHTWPQSKFSSRHNKGVQKSDLHHLFPTDSKLNSTRGNNPFGEVRQETKRFACDASRFGIATNSHREVFEPPQNHRGNVARALFYFAVRYDMSFSKAEEEILRKWSKDDPVDAEEVERNTAIHEAQGNRNPFIDFPYLEERIASF